MKVVRDNGREDEVRYTKRDAGYKNEKDPDTKLFM